MLYHCAPIPLANGAIIERGNWGRMIRNHYLTGANDGTSKIIFEFAYESARQIFNPIAPSRLDCVFCCPTLEEAMVYRAAQAPHSILYEVEPTAEEYSTHMTSWQMWGLGTGATYQASADRIRSYWQDQPTTAREILVNSSIRILQTIPT